MPGLSLVTILVGACSVPGVLAVDLTTQGPFELPLAETRLCVVAVHSPHNNVELKLVRPHDEKSVTVSLAMAKYNHESQVSAAGLGDNTAIVSRDRLNLTAQLISLFLKDNVLAVYRAGQLKPILVYKHKGSGKTDFVDFTTLYTSGPRQGYTVHLYDLDKRGYGTARARPHGTAIRRELRGVRREIQRRLGIMNAFFTKMEIDKMPPEVLKIVNDVLDTKLVQQLFLLDYYGVRLHGKYKRYRQTVIAERLLDIKAKLKGQ